MKKTIFTLTSLVTLASTARSQTYDLNLSHAYSASGHDVIGDGSLIFHLVDREIANPTGSGTQGSTTSSQSNFNVSRQGGAVYIDASFSGTRVSDLVSSSYTFIGQSSSDTNSDGKGDEYARLFNSGTWNLSANGLQDPTDRRNAWTSNIETGRATWSASSYTFALLNQYTSINSGDTWTQSFKNGSVTLVPEPSSTALLGLGALGFIGRRKRA